MLVIDEADRCLDMGFQHTVNGILENLPPGRQTLLFSATQTKCVGQKIIGFTDYFYENEPFSAKTFSNELGRNKGLG